MLVCGNPGLHRPEDDIAEAKTGAHSGIRERLGDGGCHSRANRRTKLARIGRLLLVIGAARHNLPRQACAVALFRSASTARQCVARPKR
jgi:hypothetical protein